MDNYMKTRSGRTVKPTEKMAQYRQSNLQGLSVLRTDIEREIAQTEDTIRRLSGRLSGLLVSNISDASSNPHHNTRQNAESHRAPLHSTPNAPFSEDFTQHSLMEGLPQRQPPVQQQHANWDFTQPSVPVQQTQHANWDFTQQPSGPVQQPHHANWNFRQQPAVPAQEPQLMQSFSLDLLSKLALPKLEPEVFSGDILRFPHWIKSFVSLIEENTNSPTQRLHFMDRYTSGNANDVVKGYVVQDGPEAYFGAKNALVKRYGDKYKLAEAYKRKLHQWPMVQGGEDMRKFSDFLNQCDSAMKSLSYLRCLDSAEENLKIVKKLPRYVSNRWERVIDRFLYDSRDDSYEGTFPTFSDFCMFIGDEARIACGPISVTETVPEIKKPRYTDSRPAARTFAAEAENTESSNRSCLKCRESHHVSACERFKAMNIEERKSFAMKAGLCFRCLNRGHVIRDCRRRGSMLLYVGIPRPDEKPAASKPTQPPASIPDQPAAASAYRTNLHSREESQYNSMIIPVVVYQRDTPYKLMCTYAMLDSQSNACFITDSLVSEIQAKKRPTDLQLSTMLAKEVVRSNTVKDLIIRGVDESSPIALPVAFTRDSIPAGKDLIPRPEQVRQWPHLRDIKIPPLDEDMEIGLLIGFNCPEALVPKEVKTAADHEPYAVKTNLGWGVTGVMKKGATNSVDHFVHRTHAKEVSPEGLRQLFEYEFVDDRSELKMSYEDRRFLKIVNEGIERREDGHFQLPLPFKKEKVNLPNNRQLAERRLMGLKHKMMKNEDYKNNYIEFMNKTIEHGTAERATSPAKPGSVWYLPHHGVYHPKKPGKIRVVYDGSAEYEGESLNQNLLQGPDGINNLAGVLCRFRKEKVAFICDIEGMFNQVMVNPEDRDYLRFLWFKDSDISKKPIEYRMTTHLFGAVSSPGCANFALRRTADMYEDDYGKEAADFIRNDFYVDDGLKSVSTPEDASTLINNVQELCKQGGFKLHKFVCSDRSVLSSVPQEKMKSIDLSSPVSRTLGVEWSIGDDSFVFKVDINISDPTRRSILSVISSIFDPLGLISPILLPGRLILQGICKGGHSWDDPVDEDVIDAWQQWTKDLQKIHDLQIPRCHIGNLIGTVISVELHHFSDASLTGYGMCSYLRLVGEGGSVSVSLVMSKSRVNPSKPVTVPRLELMAAVLSVKIAAFLDKEMDYEEMRHIFWTDSKVVLGYITNESRRFHMFVANRVHQIRSFSDPSQWSYIETSLNPADLASRGTTAAELVNSSLWWKGPAFLTSDLLPINQDEGIISSDDPEVRVTVHAAKVTTKDDAKFDLLDRISHISSWIRAKRVVALCLKLKTKMKEHKVKIATSVKTRSKHVKCPTLSVMEMQEAELLILKAAQVEAFHEEITVLKTKAGYPTERVEVKNRNVELKKGSNLYKLDPFMDEKGLIRIGGRIKRSGFSLEEIHPIIIPKTGIVTQLLIAHFHERCYHSGRNTTLTELRMTGYWIVRGKMAVSFFINRCVTCKKLRANPITQKMADLPPDRLEPAPPFTYSGVDLFGPFIIKDRRIERKRWGVLFACLVSRSVHIEVAHTLTTDSFLNAYRRFVGRRGKIRTLRCDCGTNFVGAKNELQAALNELDHDMIQRVLAGDDCDWIEFKFNVPHASHMGGAWERLIRSVRSALSAILTQHGGILDDESLETFMVEAELVVNSRPLTFVESSDGSDSQEALTPSQLLTLKSKVVLPPPGKFVKEDIYSRKRWRRVQFLANQFWCRWRNEYVPLLQERSKWNSTRINLAVGDIVLVVNELAPRGKWAYGRIVETYPSEDNLVRKAKVKTAMSEVDRPISKLVFLHRPENPRQGAF